MFKFHIYTPQGVYLQEHCGHVLPKPIPYGVWIDLMNIIIL